MTARQDWCPGEFPSFNNNVRPPTTTIPRFYVFRGIGLGYISEVTDWQSFLALVESQFTYYNRGKVAFFMSPDSHVYAMDLDYNACVTRTVRVKLSTETAKLAIGSIYKLHTRSSPFITKASLDGRSKFRYKNGVFVDNKLHVIMGALIVNDKPDWLLGFELEWLFS
jgi:hypothetical protein